MRTAQRWEKLGLPVRRVPRGRRSPVMANAPEIDTWLHFADNHTFPNIESRREQLHSRSERAARKICARLRSQETSVEIVTKMILDEFDEVVDSAVKEERLAV